MLNFSFPIVVVTNHEEVAFREAFEELDLPNPIYIYTSPEELLDSINSEAGDDRLAKPFLLVLSLEDDAAPAIEMLKTIREHEVLRRTIVFVISHLKADHHRKFVDLLIQGYMQRDEERFLLSEQLVFLKNYLFTVSLPQY